MYASRAFIASEFIGDLFALVGLLDAPIDHVAQRRELGHLRLVLRERGGVGVGRHGMAHSACHSRIGQHDTHRLLGRCITVEQQVALADLLHEHLLVGVQQLRRHRILVRTRRADQDGKRYRRGSAEQNETACYRRGHAHSS